MHYCVLCEIWYYLSTLNLSLHRLRHTREVGVICWERAKYVSPVPVLPTSKRPGSCLDLTICRVLCSTVLSSIGTPRRFFRSKAIQHESLPAISEGY